MRRLILLLLLLGCGPPVLAAEESGSADRATSAERAAADRYERLSDDQLTALAADWDDLDRHQRRALLTEMKVRMARGGKRGDVLHIRTERRYGRIIRQPDGRVIRIETQVVQVRPATPDELEGRHSFGVGFEKRVARRQELRTGDTVLPPVAPKPGTEAQAEPELTLDDIIDALAPSIQAPETKRLPIYQASDPKP
jgi:hypothetical protein